MNCFTDKIPITKDNLGGWVEINLDALAHNFLQVRNLLEDKCKILAVVKADAYGHGLEMVARELVAQGADMLGVTTLLEGIRLREVGIGTPILLLSGTFNSIPEVISYNLTPVVYDYDNAKAVSAAGLAAQQRVKVHVKVDTGMGRLGCMYDEAIETIPRIAELPGLEVGGIMTHFAEAEVPHSSYTQWQMDRFRHLLHSLGQKGLRFPLIHAANSAAILNVPGSSFDMVRPGLILYGALPDPALSSKLPDESGNYKTNLQPVMSFKARIISLKHLDSGCSLSYNRTYITCQPSLIAAIPVGYAEGFSRSLSNCGQVLVSSERTGFRRANVVGRVCMDISLLDVTHLPQTKPGDEVLLFGQSGEHRLPVEEIAVKAGTIPYELLCLAGRQVPRLYYKQGRLVKVQLPI